MRNPSDFSHRVLTPPKPHRTGKTYLPPFSPKKHPPHKIEPGIHSPRQSCRHIIPRYFHQAPTPAFP